MQQNLPKQGGFLNQKRWVIGILFFLFVFLTFSIGLIITSQTTLQKVNRSKESTENLKVIVSNLYDSTQIKQLLETTAANTVTEQSGVYLENTILGTKKVFYTDVLFIPETEKMIQNKKQNEKKNQITLPYIFYTRYGVKKKDNIKLYVKDKSMEFVVRGFYEDDCYGVQAVNDLVVAYISQGQLETYQKEISKACIFSFNIGKKESMKEMISIWEKEFQEQIYSKETKIRIIQEDVNHENNEQYLLYTRVASLVLGFAFIISMLICCNPLVKKYHQIYGKRSNASLLKMGLLSGIVGLIFVYAYGNRILSFVTSSTGYVVRRKDLTIGMIISEVLYLSILLILIVVTGEQKEKKQKQEKETLIQKKMPLFLSTLVVLLVLMVGIRFSSSIIYYEKEKLSKEATFLETVLEKANEDMYYMNTEEIVEYIKPGVEALMVGIILITTLIYLHRVAKHIEKEITYYQYAGLEVRTNMLKIYASIIRITLLSFLCSVFLAMILCWPFQNLLNEFSGIPTVTISMFIIFSLISFLALSMITAALLLIKTKCNEEENTVKL